MTPAGLNPSQWEQLLDGLARGEYQLLLGAGASVEARDATGRALPTGPAFAAELVDAFDIPAASSGLTLARAYEAAQRRIDRSGRSVRRYLSDRFTGCTPPDWYRYLCAVPWHRIWTLNIDDVTEQSYELNQRAARRAVSVSWHEDYREPDRAQEEVLVVHLHGKAVPSATDPLSEQVESASTAPRPEVVFDILEYFGVTTRPHVWHYIFDDEFRQKPFIVVGARLVDEYDLAAILRRGNSSAIALNRPSLVVLPSIDALTDEELSAWGLLPVQSEASSFFKEVFDALGEVQQRIAQRTPGHPKELPPQAIRFLSQFRKLETTGDFEEPDAYHDLYAGHDPKWSDILRDRDAIFEVVSKAAAILEAAQDDQRIVCIHGPRFCGKSTALLRIGRGLCERGWDVFLFHDYVGLDLDAAIWWLERTERVLLLFDGLGDHAQRLNDLVDHLRARQAPLRVLGVERERRMNYVESVIGQSAVFAGPGMRLGRLTDGDISALVTKLRTAGRLGARLTGRSRADQEGHFRLHGREIFAGMAALEGAAGFVDRLRTEYLGIRDPSLRRLYLACCVVSAAGGYEVSTSMAARVAELDVKTVLAATSFRGELAEVMERTRDKIKPRHRTMAALVIEEVCDRQDVFDLTTKLAKALAPHISVSAIQARTLQYLIVRQIMDHELLGAWIGRDRLEEWYEGVQSDFEWNARFWEQRALAVAERGQFDRAESYAANAVDRHRDPFTLNTLGTVLVRKAVEWYRPTTRERDTTFWLGVRRLRESRELARRQGRDYEHPYTTFLTYAIRLAESGGVNMPRLANEWAFWWSEASRAKPFQRRDLALHLERLADRWKTLVEGRLEGSA